MERRKEITAFIIFLVLGIFLGYTRSQIDRWRTWKEKADTAVVTWTKTDTTRVKRPIPAKSLQLPDIMKIRIPTPVYLKSQEQILVQKTDTILQIQERDSIDIELPVEQKTYTDSTRYRLVISGYNVNMEDLEIYNKTEYRQITITKTRKKRWGIGAAAGPAITNRGLGFGITLGLIYNF